VFRNRVRETFYESKVVKLISIHPVTWIAVCGLPEIPLGGDSVSPSGYPWTVKYQLNLKNTRVISYLPIMLSQLTL
jgi:hypothetical protein